MSTFIGINEESGDPSAESGSEGLRSVIVTIGPNVSAPWWKDEILADPGLCALSVCHMSYRGKVSKQIAAWELPFFLLKILPVYLELRRRCDYMFTFECSLTSFGLAFWQTLLFSRRPRHVILQFIMREKTASFASRMKYFAMKWCFRSLHLAICSATREAEYYSQAFGWPRSKTAFVPYHTSATYLDLPVEPDAGYLMAAGRVFRDYPTFYEAMRGAAHAAIVVASPTSPRPPANVKNVEFFANIPLAEFDSRMRQAAAVVVPLEDRQLSAGQLVFLTAMALGKPVIVTRTTGTTDYIVDDVNGLLVEPGNPDALRAAIERVMTDLPLRSRLGEAARRTIRENHLPRHYAQMVRRALTSTRLS